MSQVVGAGPYLRQTDGRVKSVEDDKRYAQMADNAPRQVPVESLVHRQMLDFFLLEDAHDPQREIQQQEYGDKRASGLEVCLCLGVDVAMVSVHYEQCLKCRLFTQRHITPDDTDQPMFVTFHRPGLSNQRRLPRDRCRIAVGK